MAYIITKTNGDNLVTVPDTEKNTEYGVTLVGRNYSGYGVYLNDNFISLMENFANSTSPAQPLDGQLWFNTTTATLSLWNGNAWRPLGVLTNSDSPPGTSGTSIGHMWWDNRNYQLKVWSGQTEYARTATQTIVLGNVVTVNSTGSVTAGDYVTHANISALDSVVVEQVLNSSQVRISTSANISVGEAVTFTNGIGWQTIGPVYTKDQNTNGIIPADIIDTNGIPHVAGLVYNDGQVIGTISRDIEYTPRPADAIVGFASIAPGLQLKSSVSKQFAKTVQATSIGVAGTTTFQVGSAEDLAIGDYFISGNVAPGAYVQIGAIYANNAVTIGTTTTVYQNENIVFQRGTPPLLTFNGTTNNTRLFNNKSPDAFAQLDLDTTFKADLATLGNLYAGSNFSLWDNGGDLEFRNSIQGGDISFFSNATSVGNKTRSLYIKGPDGTVEVAMNPVTALGVATKGYVDTRDNNTRDMLTANVATLIGTAPTGFRNLGLASANVGAITTTLTAVQADVALKAYAEDAALTGTPTAPTATAGTNTTQIATTAFTTSAVSTLNDTITAALALKANRESPTFTGTPVAPTAASGTNTTQVATTAFVKTAVDTAVGTLNLIPYAEKASPVFTGVPLAPTAAASVNNTQLATTAFVHSVIPAGIIMLWSGSSASIPTGWALCTGSNGTPDLRNRFVVGAGAVYSVDNTGGSTDTTVPSHTHSVSATSTFTGAALAGHTHAFSGTVLSAHTHAFSGTALATHSHTFTGDPLSTSHTHTINDPGHTHRQQTDSFNLGSVPNLTIMGRGIPGNLNGSIAPAATGITLNAASAGTPAGTNSGTSAGTPSGTNSSTSAGTPAGTNETVSAGTPAGTVGTTVTVASTGVSGTNANLPPYYALCYIMKTYG